VEAVHTRHAIYLTARTIGLIARLVNAVWWAFLDASGGIVFVSDAALAEAGPQIAPFALTIHWTFVLTFIAIKAIHACRGSGVIEIGYTSAGLLVTAIQAIGACSCAL
jgi:hypothetical protein